MTGRPPAASPIASFPPFRWDCKLTQKNVILLPSAQKKSRLKMNADGNVGGNVGGVAGNIVGRIANPRLPHLTKHVHTDSRKNSSVYL